jgi:cytochrome P450
MVLGGHTIPPDGPIVTYLIGCNHDGRWVTEADRLDIQRDGVRDHLAFGGGSHKCPGRHLAKLTIEVALEPLMRRLDGLRLDGEIEWDTENMPSVTPSRVPIAWDPPNP